MADGGYTDEEILSAEKYVLTTLEFDLSYPNPMHFLRRVSKAEGYDIQTRTLAKYLMEMSCVDHRFLSYPPSLLAAAGVWMARLVLDRPEWVSRRGR
jgi:G2/mitotic-specific cyclin 1/2